jgi:hypothetical protein
LPAHTGAHGFLDTTYWADVFPVWRPEHRDPIQQTTNPAAQRCGTDRENLKPALAITVVDMTGAGVAASRQPRLAVIPPSFAITRLDDVIKEVVDSKCSVFNVLTIYCYGPGRNNID